MQQHGGTQLERRSVLHQTRQQHSHQEPVEKDDAQHLPRPAVDHRKMFDSLIAVLLPEIEEHIAGREQPAQVDADQPASGVFEGHLVDVVVARLETVRKRLVDHFGGSSSGSQALRKCCSSSEQQHLLAIRTIYRVCGRLGSNPLTFSVVRRWQMQMVTLGGKKKPIVDFVLRNSKLQSNWQTKRV